MNNKPICGRFAPSPSGRMHLGNAWSSLLAWLSVRSQGGKMVLRLEDLDTARCKPEFSAGVEEDLRWLGLDWDEGGLEGGVLYRQSLRTEAYHAALEQLEKQQLLYECFCTRGQLHAASAPHRSDGDIIYPGTCRNLTSEERKERSKTRKPAVRLLVPGEEIGFVDRLQGAYSENLAKDCGDFILRRSDGVYAYQLAVVVDDAAMGVTEVVRGQDLLSSTPRQIYLQRLLGYPTPDYCHVPLLCAPDGRRLSKREADLTLAAMRAEGVMPEAIVGRLAHAAGLIDRPEPITPQELVSLFAVEKLGKKDIIV
jgi:glutamyl-tRNA synthetase